MVLNLRHSALSWAPAGGPGLAVPPPGAGVTGAARTAYGGGATTITTNNTTISLKNINTTIVVNATNVLFSDCYFDAGSGWGIDGDNATSMKVRHCTFIGASYNNSCILTGNDWEVTDCDLSGYENGIMVQGGTGLCTGNYIHALNGPPPDPHVDGIQISGPAGPGVLIQGNWVESWDTSCIFIKTDGGSMSGITITGNTLKNKPGQITAATIYTEPHSGRTITGTVITNNRLEAGNAGYLSDAGAIGTTWSGNVDYVTGLTANP